MDAETLPAHIVGRELVPLLSRFAQAVDHPDDPFDLPADLFWPPRSRMVRFSREAAGSRNLTSALLAECVLYVRHWGISKMLVGFGKHSALKALEGQASRRVRRFTALTIAFGHARARAGRR